jgi:hypothetical protein
MPNDDRLTVEVHGRVHTVTPEITVGPKGSPKREVWVEITPEGSEWPQVVPVEFFGRDKAAMANAIRVGDRVTIPCEIRGRVWMDKKCFLSLSALDVIEGSGTADAGPVDEAGPADEQDDKPPF